MDADSAIRSTDNDASQARLSAVVKGYLKDNHISYFVPRARFLPPRPPLINVGTFVRATAIDTLIHGWIDLHEGPVQIVSLGAGSDTRFWRLSETSRINKITHYLELDFPENTARKAAVIRKTASLAERLGADVKVEKGGMALRSQTCTLHPSDLRQPPSTTLTPFINDNTLKSNIPTLFLSECVFAYMSPEASNALIEWFAENFDECGGLLYEMFGLTDSFGRVMLQNLMSRNVTLPGVGAYPSLSDQNDRFLKHGFTEAKSLTLKTVRHSHIPPSELERISHLEILDEVEELDLVLDHYVISWGCKTPSASKANDAQGTLHRWNLPLCPAPTYD